MSFLSTLHTFGAWAEKELAALVGKAPAIEQVAASVLKYAGPALQTVVAAEAGAPAGALMPAVSADRHLVILPIDPCHDVAWPAGGGTMSRMGRGSRARR